MYAKKLRALNQLVARHVEQFGTREDFKILLEIAACNGTESCLTLKQLILSAEIPESTLKRRLARLVKMRLVLKKTALGDGRVHCYSLPEKTQKTLDSLASDIRGFRWD